MSPAGARKHHQLDERRLHADRLTTLTHGLRVLEYVSANEGATPKEIAAVLGLPLSTTYHLTNTLLDAGYLVRYDPPALMLGVGVASLVQCTSQPSTPYPQLDPLLQELADRCGDVAVLGRLVGRQSVVVSVRSVPGAPHGEDIRSGWRSATHTMALGKVLLASLDPAIALTVLRSTRLEPYTDHTITSLSQFTEELETARARGVATDVEEGEPDMCCVAARIRVPSSTSPLAIAVAIEPERFRAEPERLFELVMSAARRSTSLLATVPTHPSDLIDPTSTRGNPR